MTDVADIDLNAEIERLRAEVETLRLRAEAAEAVTAAAAAAGGAAAAAGAADAGVARLFAAAEDAIAREVEQQQQRQQADGQPAAQPPSPPPRAEPATAPRLLRLSELLDGLVHVGPDEAARLAARISVLESELQTLIGSEAIEH